MKKTASASLLAVALAFSACNKKEEAATPPTTPPATPAAAPAVAGADSHTAVTGAVLKELDAVLAAVNSVKDAASADAAKTKLDASAASLKALAGRMTKLGKPNDAQKEAMKADGEKLFGLFAKMDDAEKHLKSDPAFKPALDGFNNVGESMKEVMSAGN